MCVCVFVCASESIHLWFREICVALHAHTRYTNYFYMYVHVYLDRQIDIQISFSTHMCVVLLYPDLTSTVLPLRTVPCSHWTRQF